MLENIREKSQGTIAKVILGLVILTFAVAGVGSYTNQVDTSVAEVNGEKISQNDFEQSFQAQRSRMAQQFGEMFETLSADSAYMANMRSGVLENLINEKLIAQNANELAIRISDQQIKDAIVKMPEFQVNGVFDNNRYLALINQAGFFQSSDFRDYLRSDMVRRQFSQGLVASEFSLPYQAEQLSALQNQKRDIRFARIAAEQFKAQVELNDAEINDYYQANQTQFQNQEKVKLEYVSLSVGDIASTVEVTDQDVETYYQENIANYRQDEQRRIAHILIEFGDDEAAAEQEAQSVLAKIQQGEDFAELAKTHSDDTFSGENGGDLEWIEAGVMEPSFDDAAFALAQPGDVSELVKTSFGFHLIKLTELKAEQIQPFDEVKQEVLTLVSQQRAENKFFEFQQELARVSFEFPDTLDDAAAIINSEVKTSDWISRSGNLAPFDSTKVIDVAFSDLVLAENLNSDIIEVNDSLVMVVRLLEHQEANVKPLSEVQEQITTLLTSQKASELAMQKADNLLTEFAAGNDVTELLSSLETSFESQTDVARFGGQIDPSIVKEAFVLPHPESGAVSASTVELANGDLALVEVQAVKAGEAVVNPTIAEQKTSQLAQATYSDYVEALKAHATIKRREAQETTSAY